MVYWTEYRRNMQDAGLNIGAKIQDWIQDTNTGLNENRTEYWRQNTGLDTGYKYRTGQLQD